MPKSDLPKDDLIQAFADAYERVIAAATRAAQHGAARPENGWGPREAVAHLAGWEAMAAVRIPAIVGGLAPLEFEDDARAVVMDNAINAAFVAVAGKRSVTALCDTLRQAYQRTVALLRTVDDRHFQPGAYVYERTRGAIEHCDEHIEQFTAGEA
ncbi:MAG TPA: hypothetical protein VJN88_05215 [Ktedonobacterales bacterium]|nr:hypothetical protein [Ktedonobacterales bacterium]